VDHAGNSIQSFLVRRIYLSWVVVGVYRMGYAGLGPLRPLVCLEIGVDPFIETRKMG
jgi:hypothetical protein